MPMLLLQASNDGAVTVEIGKKFQRRIVEEKKRLFTEQYGRLYRISWPLVGVPEWIR